jgi:DNA-binding PadR family transcriptional regulator
VTSFWGESENKRKARFYRLTARGRRQLETEATEWRRVIGGLNAALGTSHES